MGERDTDYPASEGRVWKAIGDGVAAAYERDALGDHVLAALVVYRPTAAKLRDIKMRDLERDTTGSPHWIRQDEPPTEEQVAQAWGTEQEVDFIGRMVFDIHRRRREAVVEAATRPEELARRDGESPDEFYGRIAFAHVVLSMVTKRPTAELARRAGVPVGTAAAWVSRARSRGLIEYHEGRIDEEGEY